MAPIPPEDDEQDVDDEMADDLPLVEDDEVEDYDESQPCPVGSIKKLLRQQVEANAKDSDEEKEEGSRKRKRHCQDAENNNNSSSESFVEGTAAGGVTTTSPNATPGVFPSPGTSHVTLEALQNTKVAVAQFAASALAGGADSEAALQELAVLQSTLYTLQHQQVFQLQLISQLQQQLSITAQQGSSTGPTGNVLPTTEVTETSNLPQESDNTVDSREVSPSPVGGIPLIHPKPLSSLTSPVHSRPPSHHQLPQQPSPSTTPLLPPTQDRNSPVIGNATSPVNNLVQIPTVPMVNSTPVTTTNNSSSVQQVMPPLSGLCSISSSLASSIITNNDPLPLNEPNTLEMLQKRAQEVLDNASQGLLANNLADELAFRGSKGSRMSPYDGKSGNGRSEPFFKHRCRYCGKVFGSDSALQIHIRSHTGERPFKCNVCGSRFTTKGNLKVHFQRHRDKFPHVKMNPNPVPEHLDKLHPPLLQQLAACGQRPPPSPPPSQQLMGPHQGPTGAFHSPVQPFLPPQGPPIVGLGPNPHVLPPGMPPSLYRSPLLNSLHSSSMVTNRNEQDTPADLSKPLNTTTNSVTHSPAQSPGDQSHHSLVGDITYQQKLIQQRDELVKREQVHSPVVRDYTQQQQQISSMTLTTTTTTTTMTTTSSNSPRIEVPNESQQHVER